MTATQGFRIPLHTALTTPILLGGVPRRLALLNGTAFAAVTFGLHSLWCIPLFVAIHLGCAALARRDPYFLEVVVRHLRHRPYYGV